MNGAGVAATCGEDARTSRNMSARAARDLAPLPPSRTRLVYEGMPTQGRVSFARVARLFLPNLRSRQVVSLLALRSRSWQPLSDCTQRAQPPSVFQEATRGLFGEDDWAFRLGPRGRPCPARPGLSRPSLGAREGRRRALETLRTRLRAWLDGQGSKRPRL